MQEPSGPATPKMFRPTPAGKNATAQLLWVRAELSLEAKQRFERDYWKQLSEKS